MTNEEKLNELKRFLNNRKVKFFDKFRRKTKIIPSLYLPKYNIIVKISDDRDKDFYHAVKRYYHPFFIREEEGIEYIFEKMRNLLKDCKKERNERREAEEAKKRALR